MSASTGLVTGARASRLVKASIAVEELRLAETALREQRYALEQHAIVATTDVQGTITYVNEKFCAISKYSREELLGQNHRILNSGYHSREFFQQMYHAIANGKVWQGEICNRAKDGSIYWLDTTIVPFLEADGKPRQYMAIWADITERKRAEEELTRQAAELAQQAEELALSRQAADELEAFTYSVSHDLRAPLRHIGGFSRILVEDFGPAMEPEARQHLQRIEDGTRRMGLLVDELLNLARVGRHALKIQATALNAVVEEVVSLLQPETAGRVVTWKIADLPAEKCDPVLVKQVFQNLIANALKFTRNRKSASIEINHRTENGALVISVRDNGVGFDMKYTDKLFGVFQRLHRAEDFEGTGIGLAIAQRIVHKHGGRIWAEAEVDKGATFCFTLAAESNAVKPIPLQPVSRNVVQATEHTNTASAGGPS